MQRLKTDLRGIPHLAKNQRDVGHPASVAGPESDTRAGWSDLRFLRAKARPLRQIKRDEAVTFVLPALCS
jgi:hypothetical protein